MAEFDAGHRYADYKPGTDKLAAYGLAALVGGGIAAKAGLFAKLGVFLLAFKKVILAGVVAVGAVAKKMFGGKDKPTAAPSPETRRRAAQAGGGRQAEEGARVGGADGPPSRPRLRHGRAPVPRRCGAGNIGRCGDGSAPA
jgi:hypothetical protein